MPLVEFVHPRLQLRVLCCNAVDLVADAFCFAGELPRQANGSDTDRHSRADNEPDQLYKRVLVPFGDCFTDVGHCCRSCLLEVPEQVPLDCLAEHAGDNRLDASRSVVLQHKRCRGEGSG